jgi:hypothetical protein
MNTKQRLKNLRSIAPDFHRIPHFNRQISQMTHDDIELESPVEFPLECFIQEKVDGANMGISWTSGPVLRNRNHILKKGYIEKDTPAKLQFRPAWNWLHKHNGDIQKVSKLLETPITIYGEWLYAKHSILYDKLPDLFLAYDIWSVEDCEFFSPEVVEDVLSQTSIVYIKPNKVKLNSISDVIRLSEMKSDFRNGLSEGIVVKTSEGRFLKDTWKVVNKYFERREDFNQELIKNKLV